MAVDDHEYPAAIVWDTLILLPINKSPKKGYPITTQSTTKGTIAKIKMR